jgi:Flp pilus assembly protein TadG
MVIEVVVLFPLFLILLLLSVQGALWYIADQSATAAATVGARALATGDTGWKTAADDATEHDLGDPQVQALTAPNGMSEVKVSGTAAAILPFPVHVSSTSLFVTQQPVAGG